MIQVQVKAKGKCELPDGKTIEYVCNSITIDKCESIDELQEHNSHEDILAKFYKSYVIEKQAEMRREKEEQIFKDNGFEKISARTLPPELKVVNAALGKMSKEQREAFLAKIQSII